MVPTVELLKLTILSMLWFFTILCTLVYNFYNFKDICIPICEKKYQNISSCVEKWKKIFIQWNEIKAKNAEEDTEKGKKADERDKIIAERRAEAFVHAEKFEPLEHCVENGILFVSGRSFVLKIPVAEIVCVRRVSVKHPDDRWFARFEISTKTKTYEYEFIDLHNIRLTEIVKSINRILREHSAISCAIEGQ